MSTPITFSVRLVAVLFAAFVCLMSASAQAPELVLHSGKIVTVDGRHGTVQALAARGGRILAVGTNEEIRKLIGAGTRVINLRGRTAIPGFIEGHGHFTGVGNATLILDLSKVDNWGQVVDMVAEAAKRPAPGEWILGPVCLGCGVSGEMPLWLAGKQVC
jgi:predicted amidohydrolase YtcJ